MGREGDERVPLEVILEAVAARRTEFTLKRHVPRDMIVLFKRAGLYRAATPKCFGGDALPPAEFLRIVERIAAVDGSSAWVASFGSANVYLAALPSETQALLYATGPDQVFAGGLFPVQPALAVEGGFEVSGTWKFASGCKGAEWLGVGVGTHAGTGTGPSAGAKPRMAVFKAAELEIVENWDVVGMQGTGSHDLRAHKQFVADAWTFVRGSAAVVDEPLYRYPTVAYAAQVLAVVNLGLARAALDVLNPMSGGRKTTTGAPQLVDRPYFRMGLAKAETKLRATQAFFYDTTETVWGSIMAGNTPGPDQISLLRLAATEAAQAGADIVQVAYRLAGIAAIYTHHPLQQYVRDAMVVTQHAFLGEGNFDAGGAVFAGGTPFPGYI
jgi:alkylation response protein AidB-like acyl-CoA dehydrogenase